MACRQNTWYTYVDTHVQATADVLTYESRWRFRREGIDESDVNVTGGGKKAAERSESIRILSFPSLFMYYIILFPAGRFVFFGCC